MSGFNLMASQIGGAIAPLLVIPIQSRYGWRVSFFVFGLFGLAWATVWYIWFRDSPEEKNGEHPPGATLHLSHAPRFQWRIVFQSPSALALITIAFCYVYVYNFFQTWFHTFLVRGRGFSEENLLLSALPYAVAVCTNLAGGAVSDALVRRLGLKQGRRTLGVIALAAACLFTVASMITHRQALTVIFLALVYGAITFQQSGVFGVCLDIGQKHAGAVVGLMNTAAQTGGLLGSVAYGYIVAKFGYDAPFIPMAALLFLGAVLWLKVDATQELSVEPRTASEKKSHLAAAGASGVSPRPSS